MGTKIKRFFKKIRIKRTTVLVLVFVFMSATLVRQLFELQIIQGEAYISKFESRTTKKRVIKSTRGNIYDRNGEELATNVLAYSVTFEDNGTYDSTRQKNLTLNGVAYKVLKILAENGDQLSNSFHIKLDKDGNYAFDVEEGFTLSRFKADIYGHALIDDLTEDEAAAKAVIDADDAVDYDFNTIKRMLAAEIAADPGKVDAALDVLMVIKYLERIGDHAVNIAEWVEFLRTGRYHHEKMF